MMPRAHARTNSTDTSLKAADSVTRLLETQRHILGIIKEYGPITDNDIFSRIEMKVSPSGARSRRAELVERGMVRDSGQRETLESGRLSIRWEAVPSVVQLSLI